MLTGLEAGDVLVGLLVLVLGPSGAAWVAVKVSLNGVREKVDDVHRVITHDEHGNIALHQRVKGLEGGRAA